MRTLAIILTLFISIDAMSQCMSDGSKMLSGTIIVKKINVTPEEGIPYLFTTYSGIESIYTKVTVAVPDELAYTLAQYSAMANNYDKRYESVSAFNVRITKDDSSETLFSLNRVLTTEMMDALSLLRKEGGTAVFHAIKTQREAGTISLPSFKYVVPKPATSSINLMDLWSKSG